MAHHAGDDALHYSDAPAGLLVYWLVGNLVGFGQQILINRMLKSKDDEEQPPAGEGPAKAHVPKKVQRRKPDSGVNC